MAFTKVTNAGIGSTGTVLLKDVNATGIVTAGVGVSTVDGFFSGVTTTSTLKSTAITGSGVLTISDTTESTSTSTGSVIISGGVGIAKTLHVGGSVSVGGTLTYEDVTNVDSVGVITSRVAVKVGSGVTLSKDGDGFFTGIVTATTFKGALTGNVTGDVTGAVSGAATKVTVTNQTGDSSCNVLFTQGATGDQLPHSTSSLTFNSSTGALTATSFSGDGSSLTGLQAGKFLTDGIGITTVTPVGIETSTIARKDLTGPAGNTATGAGSSFHGAYLGDGFLSFNTEFSNSSGYYISTFTNSLVAGPIQLGSTLTLDGNLVIV